jgi:putative oxidoreductase
MSLFSSPTRRQIDTALAVLRVVLGAIFIMHGGQKLFVYGFAGVTGAFGQMGIPMPGLLGPFVALVEFFGGIAIVLGLLTRLAAFGVGATMVVAILTVHLKNGFFAPTGVEFPLSLLASALTLVITGAGAYSLDALLGRRLDTVSVAERAPATSPARARKIA